MPLDCEEKLLKMHLPSHSSVTVCSIELQILASVMIIKSAFFLERNFKTFRRLGFFPMELGLKHTILNFDAELTHSPIEFLAIALNYECRSLLYL